MQTEVSVVLDVTSNNSYIALIVNQTLKQFDIYENKNNLSDSLIEYISHILSKQNLALKDINNIYLVYGPGKFSAMRIGATVAKSLSLLNKSNLYIIDKFDYISSTNGWVVVKSDGNKSFICHYSNNKKDTTPQLVEDSRIKDHVGNEQVIYESDNKDNIINKLPLFKKVDYTFELEYLKKPC